MESDRPTEEAMYGELNVSREGADGPYRIVFDPVGHNAAAPTAGHVVESLESLRAFLQDLGLSDEQVADLFRRPGRGLRVLVATTVLKRESLI